MAEIVPIRPDIEIPDELKGGVQGIRTPDQVENIVSQPHYDIETVSRLENELATINLTLPATRSPDIPQILGVIKQITGGDSLQDIYQYLEDTSANPSQSRHDVQRCGILLQKIAGIEDDKLNWGLIFTRLQLDKEAA